MTPRLSAPQRAAISQGWSAADVDASELVDDAWIAANTSLGKAPSTTRAVGGRVLAAVRTFGQDPLEGQEKADLSGLLPKLPRPVRRALIQKGGLTRDQMRRIAARTGYPYVEAWSAHNKGAMSGVWGAMVHHTGTPWSAAGDYPTLRIVRDGRPGLVNSLSAFGLGKSGTIYLISEKVSWHAGAGAWNGMTDGNGKTVGIEAESDGKNWTDQERDAYPRLVASILVEIGQDDKYTTRHGSYALPKGRKHDASGLDMDLFWRQVYAYLANPASIHKDYGTVVPAPSAEHIVTAGETLWSISVRYKVTVAQLKTWNGLTSDTIAVGQRLRVVEGTAPAPAPTPPPPPTPAPPAPPRPSRFGWPLRTGHYYGHKSGPATSHGGYNASERDEVRNIQQWLIFRGCVPGVASGSWATSRWADGLWEDATSAAMRTWFARYYPGQQYTDRCYRDDYTRLTA